MEVQSDVKRSNFSKVPTQLYHDRTGTANQTSISHFSKQASIPSLLLVTFALAPYRLIHCFFFLKYNYFILGKSIIFCNFTLKEATHGLMANRGLQLAAAEEQRRTLNSNLCCRVTTYSDLALWLLEVSKHHLGVARAQKLMLCAGVILQHRAQQHCLPGMELPLLSSPLSSLMLLLRAAHEISAASFLGQASSETIPCIPCCACMGGADFCGFQVTLVFPKHQPGNKMLQWWQLSPAARDSKLHLGSHKVHEQEAVLLFLGV